MRILGAALCLAALNAAAASVSFSTDVRPLLEQRCGFCHSPEARNSGFQVSSVAALLAGGRKNGPAIVPGKPDVSPIIKYVTGENQPRMPKGMSALSDKEVQIIRDWIAQGAKDDSQVTSQAPASDSAKALSAALFSESTEQLTVLRRNLRLAYVKKPPAPPVADAAYTNPIDQFILAKWQSAGFKDRPALASDADFLRRISLDLIGVIPTIEEAKAFLDDKSPDKRETLIDTLLARDADYAANWTPFWEEALASSDTGVVGGIVRHGDYRSWIYQSFATNKPYDVMVTELIDPTSSGYQKPIPIRQNGDYNVYPSYVLNADHDQTIQTAANVGQVFLGTGMKCASCHNHFLNPEWTQARFLAFAGMFASSNLEIIRCEARTGKFAQAQFPFALPDAPKDVPGDVNSRLHRVAQLLTDPTEDRFSKTIVNRLWKRYLGLGLFEPVDDFRADRLPSHPELLDWLAYDFMEHGEDLKHTIRLILTSRTYQLQYDPALEDHFEIAKPDAPRYFRSPSLRRLTAEQLLDSVQLAGAQSLDPKDRLYLQHASTDLTRALGRPAAHNEVSTGRAEDVAVVQALELLNGAEFHTRVYNAPILKENLSVERLYWAVFSRPPSEEEQKLGERFLTGNPGGDALGDMLWAMFASPAFEYVK